LIPIIGFGIAIAVIPTCQINFRRKHNAKPSFRICLG